MIAIQEVEADDLPAARAIDISFFSHRGRKSTQLLGNADEGNFIKARREWMDFDFVDLIYVTEILVHAIGYENYHELELSFQDFISKTTSNLHVKFEGGAFRFRIDRFIGGFGLRPNERWFKDSKLTRIEVSGIEQKHFSEVISVLQNINGEKQKVESFLNQYLQRAEIAEKRHQELIDQLEELESDLVNKTSEGAKIKEDILQHSRELATIQKEVAITEAVRRNVDDQVQTANNHFDSMTKKAEILAKNISDKEIQLRSLENDINLFPTEIAGYVTQGAKNVSLYAWLCLAPLAVIIVVTVRLFMNSEKILSYSYDERFTIIDFLISRLPYVAVSTIVLAVCYTLLHRLITEIIGINRRRQDLFKVSIIATDVSYASQMGLNLSDEEQYNLRTQTKMDLLKEHLRRHIGEEYVYNPKSSVVHTLSTKIASTISDDTREESPHPQGHS
ncbi:hypothetical protein ATY76_04690 [Rhizobium sp. R339]|nr:hypothetical protein ATY76_04690 [Rhizobium sp. R339]